MRRYEFVSELAEVDPDPSRLCAIFFRKRGKPQKSPVMDRKSISKLIVTVPRRACDIFCKPRLNDDPV